MPDKEIEPQSSPLHPEVLKPIGSAQTLSPEVADIIENREQNLSQEIKPMVEAMGEKLPHEDPTNTVNIPISDEKIIQGLEQPVSSSWRWLSEFFVRVLKQAHISLKSVHGRVKRVLTS